MVSEIQGIRNARYPSMSSKAEKGVKAKRRKKQKIIVSHSTVPARDSPWIS